MRIKLARQLSLALAVLFILSFCLLDVNAQTRRRKRSRRATNPIVNNVTPVQPATSQPATPDPQIISTAEEQSKEANDNADTSPKGARRATRSRTGTPEAEQDSMRRTVNRLSTQVNQLTDKLSQMEEQQRTLVNLERLSRAEQRAENLRAQLRDVQAKEADLQARAEQLDYALQPENLDNSLAAFGSTRPEVLREQRRRQLENERTRVHAQLDQLATSRTRLESAIANADAEADRIRQLVDTTNTPNIVQSDATGITTDSNTSNNTNAPPVINGSPRSAPGTSTQTDTSNSNPPL
jgi:small-conductance mechanosensitive channel